MSAGSPKFTLTGDMFGATVFLLFLILGNIGMIGVGINIVREKKLVLSRDGTRALVGASARSAGRAIIVTAACLAIFFAVLLWRTWLHGMR